MNIDVEISTFCHSAQLPSKVWRQPVAPDMFGQEVAMGNCPKQPGHAVLSRDGTVKLNGKKVGYWTYEPRDIMPWATYSFSFEKDAEVSCSFEKDAEVSWSCFGKDTFKAHLPRFLDAFKQGKKYE